MKDGEWQRSKDKGRWREGRERNVRMDRERDPPYKPKYHRYTPLATTRSKALMMVKKSNLLQWPQHTRFTPAKKYSNKYCRFHKEKGHDTEECYQLKDEIERLVRQGYFKEYKLERDEQGAYKGRCNEVRNRSRSRDRFRDRQMEGRNTTGERDNVPMKGVINTIAGGLGAETRKEAGSSRKGRVDRQWELGRHHFLGSSKANGTEKFKVQSRTNPFGWIQRERGRFDGNHGSPSFYGGGTPSEDRDG
ncbi:UNVERIFIED_CONTAM: hypothetical protein Sradi_0476600 [Sesamum radiatum]|uniref:Uncharacterized protein n=1 Tax=Sesamum radiatum TaxID=300843 RepID=A0AAW2WBT0_SESRA